MLADANGPVPTEAPTSLNDLLGATGATGFSETISVDLTPEIINLPAQTGGINWLWIVSGLVILVAVYFIWKIIKK
jgi:hypothetical protein